MARGSGGPAPVGPVLAELERLYPGARTELDHEHTAEYHFSDIVIMRKQVECHLLRLWYVCLLRAVPQLRSPRLRQ